MKRRLCIILLIISATNIYSDDLLPEITFIGDTSWIKKFYYELDKNRDTLLNFINNNSQEKNSLYLQSLLGYWINKNPRDIQIDCNLHKSLPSKSEIISLFLTAKVDPYVRYKDPFGGVKTNSLLGVAIEDKNYSLLKKLFVLEIYPDGNDLLWLYNSNSFDLLTFIIKNGGDINTPIQESFGDGAYGKFKTDYLINIAVNDGNMQFIEKIMEFKPDLNMLTESKEYRDDGEETYSINTTGIALLKSSNSTHKNIYDRLLEEGANLPKAEFVDIPYGVTNLFSGYSTDKELAKNWCYQNLKVYHENGKNYIEAEKLDLVSYYKKYRSSSIYDEDLYDITTESITEKQLYEEYSNNYLAIWKFID